MKSQAVLFGGRLTAHAFDPVLNGRSAFSLCLEKAGTLQGVDELVLLLDEQTEIPEDQPGLSIIRAASWNLRLLLETLEKVSASFDLVYFLWADTPFLDRDLSQKLCERHMRYAAEYSYADGWPYGLVPELLYPSSLKLLSSLLDGNEQPVERDSLFGLIQKEINSFDIETELAPVDLRKYRLNLAADSKRNLLLLRRLYETGLESAASAAEILQDHQDLLRTLPAFYQIQVSGPCPHSCSFCPYPLLSQASGTALNERSDFMAYERFCQILDAIESFSGDALIDLSLWGEASLHPDIERIIEAVLLRDQLSLIIESTGIGWKPGVLERVAEKLSRLQARNGGIARLSWILSLDTDDPARYQNIRGSGFEEAKNCVQRLTSLFPGNVYVQALRIQGEEDDLERFYRNWKALGVNVIVQKYDNFCGFLPDRRAGDISPVTRSPCWHLMRDMSIQIDGRVALCREDLQNEHSMGNVFTNSLEQIWEKGNKCYKEHCSGLYSGICAGCDEYYTYNF